MDLFVYSSNIALGLMHTFVTYVLDPDMLCALL